MPRDTKNKIISALSTAFIVFLLYVVFNVDFVMPVRLKNAAPPQIDSLDIETEELDLNDLLALQPEITETKPEPEKTAVAESAPRLTNDNPPDESETQPAKDLAMENNDDSIAQLPPPDFKRLTVATPEKSMIPDSIQNDIEQFITKNGLNQPAKNGQQKYLSERDKYVFYRKHYRQIYNFMKVYPYAIRTHEIIDSVNIQLAQAKNEAEQKKMIKQTEKMLFDNYNQAIRTMSTSQGRILLKLIYRETNKTGYDLIKEYKGNFSATFWYAVGKLFNTDLKTTYDKNSSDSIYEEIIRRYNNGEYKMMQKNKKKQSH